MARATPWKDLWSDRNPDAPSATERQILRAAIDLFGRYGYVATSVRAIAGAAEVTPPLIGYHFRNKEGLFLRCVDVVFGELTEGILASTVDDEGLRRAVETFARALMHTAERHPDAIRFALTVVYGPSAGLPASSWSQRYHETWRWAARLFESAIESGEFTPREGVDVHTLVRHLFHSVHLEVFEAYDRQRFAHEFSAICDDCPEPADRIAEVVDQFFQGAGALRETNPSERES